MPMMMMVVRLLLMMMVVRLLMLMMMVLVLVLVVLVLVLVGVVGSWRIRVNDRRKNTFLVFSFL
jgi:hypothetical protein